MPASTLTLTVALLVCSNVFMTFAWYGHLRELRARPLMVAILAAAILKEAFTLQKSVGLVLIFPVLLIIGALIKLMSPGPALYHQHRVGQYGRVITIHKFRSMQPDAEHGTGTMWAAQNDQRVTRFGRFLRRTRLDELPQLWNVLTGEMSLVGPRPERPEFVSQLSTAIPFYGLRHGVRPGITGWAQVRYTYGASVEDAMEKLQYDLFYIKHRTMAFDLFILLSTMKTVILQKGAQ